MEEISKFSDALEVYQGKIKNSALQDSLLYLSNTLGEKYKLLKWDDYRVAVPLELKVDLPSLGNYKDIDIRKTEPILLVFNTSEYPYFAPNVLTDRLDFPKDKLPHLFVAQSGKPPAICYVRGDKNEWYANKLVKDLIIRVGNWFNDAATGKLALDGDEFDPLRLEGYSGNIVYDYDKISSVVREGNAYSQGCNFAVALFELINTDTESYKFVDFITEQSLLDSQSSEEESLGKKALCIGFLVWGSSDVQHLDYDVVLPHDLNSFKDFCDTYTVDYTSLIRFIVKHNLTTKSFPVIVAINRPAKIYGFTSNYEMVNFSFKIKEEHIVSDDLQNFDITFQSHNQPLTQDKARTIAGIKERLTSRILVFGLGALGSKIAIHLGRSGYYEMTLIDPDHLSPHNLVRHALYSDKVGENKAYAVAETLQAMFSIEQGKHIFSGPSFKDGYFEKPELFVEHGLIFDFTASETFFNKLTLAQNITQSKLFSGSLTNFGKMGVLLKEGVDRNPRIDDLQVHLYSLYKSSIVVRSWLVNEQKHLDSISHINVGIGCNTETTVLSDDKVATHSAYFAGVLVNEMSKADDLGKVYLSSISDHLEYEISTSVFKVKPFVIKHAINDASWEIRFKEEVIESIKSLSKKAGRKETGGVFIGVANYKTRTIHVVDNLPAPSDSKATEVCFYRGHQKLAKHIKDVNYLSGGQLGYIGEWHSHPVGPNALSNTDMEAVRKFKTEFETLVSPLPVFLTIVAPDGILSYVY